MIRAQRNILTRSNSRFGRRCWRKAGAPGTWSSSWARNRLLRCTGPKMRPRESCWMSYALTAQSLCWITFRKPLLSCSLTCCSSCQSYWWAIQQLDAESFRPTCCSLKARRSWGLLSFSSDGSFPTGIDLLASPFKESHLSYKYSDADGDVVKELPVDCLGKPLRIRESDWVILSQQQMAIEGDL